MDEKIKYENVKKSADDVFKSTVVIGQGELNLWIETIRAITGKDVVEVVRCEKCVHKVDYKGRVMCGRRAIKYDGGWGGLTATDNDRYCSYGEKQKDGKM